MKKSMTGAEVGTAAGITAGIAAGIPSYSGISQGSYPERV
jgi:hypothetical protein